MATQLEKKVSDSMQLEYIHQLTLCPENEVIHRASRLTSDPNKLAAVVEGILTIRKYDGYERFRPTDEDE